MCFECYCPHVRGKVSYLRCQLPEALAVYTEATKLAKDQREMEHIVLYEKGLYANKQHVCWHDKVSNRLDPLSSNGL